MGYFDHDVENKDTEKELKERELQLAFLKGALELRKEELEADFDNLVAKFNEAKENDYRCNGMFERLRELETSLSRFLEVRAEIHTTELEISIAKGEEEDPEDTF